MHHIRDKKRWWAVNFCQSTSPIRPNPMFDVLAPIGMTALLIGAIALVAFAFYAPEATGGLATATTVPVGTLTEINRALETLGRNFDEYKKVNDEAVEAGKKGNEGLVKELSAKLDKIEKDIKTATELRTAFEKEQQFQRERLEELETRAARPVKTPQEKLRAEHKDAFIGWIRSRGQDTGLEAKMTEIAKKDVTIGTPAAGGYAVPEDTARDIEILEKKFSPVRALVKVVRVGTSDYKELVNERGATSGWVGETATRAATNTPQLREATPTFGELYAYPQVSEWSLDDIFFDVEDWLKNEIAEAMSIDEATAVISGNGTSKPTGMLNSTPTTAGDFAGRAAAVYQYIDGVQSPVAIDPDKLIDLIYALNSRYRAGSQFIMNSVTTGMIRKLKDQNDHYLWQPGLQLGQPDRLLGYPTSTWEQLADPNGASFPLAFGNFKRGYVLADRVGLRITRDQVTNVGFVRFYVRRREGGIVLNNDAIKWLKA